MTARRSVLSLTVVCALLFSAFAAASASAAEGTTTFTCVKGSIAVFHDADCTSKEGTLEYKHVEVEPGLKTKTSSKSTTAQVLEGTISGIAITIECTADTATGEGINVAGTPMSVSGSEIVIKYTGCTVTKPAGKSCAVKGGAITTNTLKSTTSLTTTPAGVKFEPAAGTEFVAITIEKCTVAALNGTFPVKGSEIAVPEGALLKTSGEAGLSFAGNPAKLGGTNTVFNTGSGTALALTKTAS